MSNRVIRDGKVAVLVSPGFGAGWSTWITEYPQEEILFSPALVAAVENGSHWRAANELFPEACKGGVDQLEIKWVTLGRRFIVREYDGAEHLEFDDETQWMTP